MPTEITIDLDKFIWILTAIGLVGAAAVYIKKAASPLLKPLSDVKKRVTALEKTNDENEGKYAEYFTNDRRRLDDQEVRLKELSNDNKEMLQAILLLMKHAATGNCTGDINKGMEKLQNYIINERLGNE